MVTEESEYTEESDGNFVESRLRVVGSEDCSEESQQELSEYSSISQFVQVSS